MEELLNIGEKNSGKPILLNMANCNSLPDLTNVQRRGAYIKIMEFVPYI